MALQIRIPPPDQQLIEEKGLQLRSVRAQLRRHIRERSTTPEIPDQITTTVLAVSGKSCRFSATRDVFLRLTLHSCLARPHSVCYVGSTTPSKQLVDHRPSPIETISPCETITQSTILFDVYFTISVIVSITGREGERQDLEIERDIGIVPDWPPLPIPDPTLVPSASKAEEASEETEVTEDERKSSIPSIDRHCPAPKYFERDDTRLELDDRLAEASTSQLTGLDFQRIGPIDWDDDEDEEGEGEEEEYDGYESFSSYAGEDGPAPPTIDEDESPPPAPDTPPEGIELRSPLIVPFDHPVSFEDPVNSPSGTFPNVIDFRTITGGTLVPYALGNPIPHRLQPMNDLCGPAIPLRTAEDPRETLSSSLVPLHMSTQPSNHSHDSSRISGRLTDEEVGRPPAYAVDWLNQTQSHPPPIPHHVENPSQHQFLENVHPQQALHPSGLDTTLSSMFLNLAGHSVHHAVDPTHHSPSDTHNHHQLGNLNDPIISSDGSIQPPPYAADFS